MNIDLAQFQPQEKWVGVVCPNCKAATVFALPVETPWTLQATDVYFPQCLLCGSTMEA